MESRNEKQALDKFVKILPNSTIEAIGKINQLSCVRKQPWDALEELSNAQR